LDNDCDGLVDLADPDCKLLELVESDITNGSVMTMVESGGVVYIGGSFTAVGPRTGSFVAVDRNTGQRAPDWPQVAGNVYKVVPDGNGGWFIGGWFTHINGIPRGNLAHILSDGTLDGWDPGSDGPVIGLAVSGSLVYSQGNRLTGTPTQTARSIL
jgi:hypothetical protein